MAAGRRPPGVVLDDPPGDGRGQQGVAGGHHPHRVHQLLGRGVLEQEPAGPGPERLEDVVVALEGGEDHDPAGDVGLPDDAAGGLQAVHPRHLDVHEHHVRSQLPGGDDGLLAVARPRRRPRCRPRPRGSSGTRLGPCAWSSTSTTLMVIVPRDPFSGKVALHARTRLRVGGRRGGGRRGGSPARASRSARGRPRSPAGRSAGPVPSSSTSTSSVAGP